MLNLKRVSLKLKPCDFEIKPVMISGKEVLPIVEGGKGVSISTGETSGAFAAAGAVGTVSVVNPNVFQKCDVFGKEFLKKTRKERNDEFIKLSIEGAIEQIKIAYEKSCGKGRIHINALWEMASVEKVLEGVMEKVKDLVHGITCGAGLPYKLGEIATKYQSFYYPIVSSSRALQILYKRSYNKFKEFLGGIVYEDPWSAGGHIGISNAEDPTKPENPYVRVRDIRRTLNSFGLAHIPIIIAGGVWWLSEWQDYINNPEVGEVAFQFGTRPLITKESPVAESWAPILTKLNRDDIIKNKFSPTGLYSSAINNNLLKRLNARLEREFEFSEIETELFNVQVNFGARSFFFKPSDEAAVQKCLAEGFSKVMKTPDNTVILVTLEEGQQILRDQGSCVGCLSYCRFSNWNQKGVDYFTPDPRSFCIQRSLQNVAQGKDLSENLMFVGSNAWRFSWDPFYQDEKIPTVQELVDRILTGY